MFHRIISLILLSAPNFLLYGFSSSIRNLFYHVWFFGGGGGGVATSILTTTANAE